MSEVYKKFVKESKIIPFDLEHRRKINYNISRYAISVEKGKKQFKNLELAKQRAAAIKYKVIENLDEYLIEFELNFEKNGGKVIWAQTGKDAIEEILKILKRQKAKHIVKSKSMITEEIEFNRVLEENNIESLETDLGEYIVQLAGEKPYHIVTPAMHKSKEDIAKLFNEKFNMPIESTPDEITAYVREKLRKKFIEADVGVTGGNFLIADTGSVALTENEGNGLMSVSFPKVHIAIVGIEKIIPSIKYLDIFWPLLSTYGTGQKITVYNSIISGPKKKGEIDGPDEMYVILLDNRRTEILKKPIQRKVLTCIRCGACLNNCPVYKNIGGYTYNSTYTGPIGSVITPFLNGMKDYKHLSFASSLCGKCTEICPVKINLHELLLQNRNDSVKEGYAKGFEKLLMYASKKILINRWMMDVGGGKIKNLFVKTFVKKIWGPRRTVPHVAKKNFKQLWNVRRGNN